MKWVKTYKKTILFSIFLFYTKNPLPKTEKLLILGNECVIIDLRGDFL